jgi:DNA primase
MDQKLIDQINEKTAIVDLVSEFVTLKKTGKNFVGLCPFHQEKTPSFSVSPEKNIAKCMSCGEGGNPINFFRKIKNISFEEAAAELAERAGIEVKKINVKKDPYENYYALMSEVANFYEFNLRHSEKGLEALRYLYDRQMTDELIKHFRLGFAPSYGSTLYQVLKNKNFSVSDMINLGVVKQSDQGDYYDLFSDRIIFPITDAKGRVVGLSGRTTHPKEPAKYINSPETIIFKKGMLLYHFNEALPEIRKLKQVVLYEGFFDVISSYGAGIMHGVATMGTALTKDQAKLIKSVSPSIIIAYDGDQAGLKASDHAIPILEKEQLKIEVLTIPEKMDPDDFIKAYGPEAYEKLFGEFTEDSFQFRYRYYKIGKDLKNANDLKDFKRQIVSMVQYVDSSIRAHYLSRLSTEFSIPIAELDGLKPTKDKEKEPIKIPPKERSKMPSKYEQAERFLIMAMLRSKTVSRKVMNALKSSDFAEVITASIRLSIDHYYDDHVEMNLDHFLDTLNTEQRDVMENTIMKDIIWKKNLPLDDVEVDKYITLVILANDHRRFMYLNHQIETLQEVSEALVNERDQLKKRLDKNKEEASNGS